MILVTGASGFLGQHLVRHLSEQGKNIRALYNKNKPGHGLTKLPGVNWQQCDLLDVYAVEEAMANIDEVYHCAGIVSFHPSEKKKLMHFNVTSTAHIVNEALEKGIRKLVHVSSVAALGRNDAKQTEITEEAEWEESKRNSQYALSKYFAEMEVWRGIGEGLNAAIVNPGIVLGEGNWDVGSSRLMKIVNKEFPFFTRGINSFVDVKDVVCAMVQIMSSDIHSERFIISAGNFSYKDIFTMMANELGKRPPHIAANNFLTSLVWRWSMMKSRIFGETATITKETARTSQAQAYYNNEKLLRHLAAFEYTDMKSTIKRMARAFIEDDQKKN